MSYISWSRTFSDGEILSAADLEALKSDITAVVNGNITDTNVSTASITNSKLASPNHAYCIPLPLPLNADALASAALANSRVGVNDTDGAAIDIPFKVPIDSTLFDVHTSCKTSTGTNTVSIVSGTTVLTLGGSATTVAFTTGTAVTQGGTIDAAIGTGDTMYVRFNTSSGSNDGVVAPMVWLWLKASHLG
jgi:hypothetical protein